MSCVVRFACGTTTTNLRVNAAVIHYLSYQPLGPPAGSLATDLPNIVVIGDSVSIGWTPVLRQLLAGKATVLHNPNSGDGGARSTSDMLQCLKYRLSTADLAPFPPNVRPEQDPIQKGTRVLISLWDSLMLGRGPGTPPKI